MDPKVQGGQRLLAPFNKERLSSFSHSLMVHLSKRCPPLFYLPSLHYLPSAHALAAKA
jgi:hypothetical protein